MNTEAKPFTPETQVIARLLEAAGFRLSRGTYVGEHADFPTLCVNRPRCPAWNGVFEVAEPGYSNEHLTAIYAAGSALEAWKSYSQS